MSTDLDPIWKALSDKTRREIVEFLRDDARGTTEIVEQFPSLSRFAVMKHLDVLRQADLVRTRIEGRRRINSLNVKPIRELSDQWIGKFEAYWSNSLEKIKKNAEAKSSQKP